MAAINAFGFYGIAASCLAGQWGLLVFLVAGLIGANVIYFWNDRRTRPWKYLYPAAIMLLIFQVFVVIYTAGIAFTNYGDGHNSTKADAITAIELKYDEPVPDAPTRPVAVLSGDEGLGLAVLNDDGSVLAAHSGENLTPVDATVEDGRITAVPGFEVLTTADAMARQQEVLDIRVGSSDEGDVVRTNDARTGMTYVSTMRYDEARDAMIAADCTVNTPDTT